MSGFEIAGIVLGAIPLLISALEHYADGLSTLQRWRKHKREINSLIRNLETERIKLENVCEKLLLNLVPHSQIEDLISNPMGDRWTDKEIQEKIQFRLGKGFNVFESTVIDLRTNIDEMAERIASQSEGITVGIKRVVFALSRTQYTDLLNHIRESVSNLENLTDRNMELEPARRVRSRERLFTLLRAMSDSLYRALKSSLHCRCEHDIGLHLENRISKFAPTHDEDKLISRSADSNSKEGSQLKGLESVPLVG
ncbi:hypothetical protein NW768_007549 [Fusarium equiseti]|uniref:Fungal N-terminal domain-containing protein n=1 Tax=Fusarium equiseti TaxID=61235 RepID=A0ABQ8R7T2_FUSEQ|nr:hypothetical protein NW768_007549 [Fusarium equiseti]